MRPEEIRSAFETHVREIKGYNCFESSKLTISRSSLRKVFAELDRQIKAKTYSALNSVTVLGQLRKDSPKDHVKYLEALNLLFAAWPYGQYTIPSKYETTTTGTTGGINHYDLWSSVTITDIPTGRHGQYNYHAKDSVTTGIKGAAGGRVRSLKTERGVSDLLHLPEYWAALGALTLKKNMTDEHYGRCFSCAGVAISTLAQDPAYDGSVLVSVGSFDTDHHFVLVGTIASQKAPGLIAGDLDLWGETVAVDIWQANLNHNQDYEHDWKSFHYRPKSRLKLFCELLPGDRAGLRSWLDDEGLLHSWE